MITEDRPAPPGGYPIHERTGRPTVRGVVVPWITRWSEEDAAGADLSMVRDATGVRWLAYPPSGLANRRQPLASFLTSQRDPYGILWLGNPDAQGNGDVQFSAVHADRQRRCMMERRCQVCGGRFPKGTPLTFLARLAQFPADSTAFRTHEPPVCLDCVPYASAQCPHLRAETLRVVTSRVLRPVAVIGDIYDEDPKPGPDGRHGPARVDSVELGDALLRLTLAKQLVAEVRSYS